MVFAEILGECDVQKGGGGMLFISYAHADGEEGCERVRAHLVGASAEFGQPFWYDEAIPVGAAIPEEIEAALNGCTGAVLILTKGFLASEFIRTIEVPRLLARGVPLFPVYWSACVINAHGWLKDLKRWPMDTPLRPMSEDERDAALVDFVSDLIEQGALSHPPIGSETLAVQQSEFDGLLEQALEPLTDNERRVIEDQRVTKRAKAALGCDPETWTQAEVADLARLMRRIMDALADKEQARREVVGEALEGLAALERLWRGALDPNKGPGQPAPLTEEMAPLLAKGGEAAERLARLDPPGPLADALADLSEELQWIEMRQSVRLGDLGESVEKVRARAGGAFRSGASALMAAIGKRAELAPPGTVFKDLDEPWAPEMVVIPAGAFTMGHRRRSRSDVRRLRGRSIRCGLHGRLRIWALCGQLRPNMIAYVAAAGGEAPEDRRLGAGGSPGDQCVL